MPNTPPVAEILKKPGKWTLVAEWFRVSYDSTSPPKNRPGVLPETGRWKPRSKATDFHASSDDEAKLKEIEKEGQAIRPQLYKVIIKVKYKKAAAKTQ